MSVDADRILYSLVWMPDGSALIVTAKQIQAGNMQTQIGDIDYPQGNYRAITADTNDYSHLGISKDGKTIVAIQGRVRYALGTAPASEPDQLRPLSLASNAPVFTWNWMADVRLIIPQSGDLKAVSVHGSESTIFSDPKHIPDQAAVCGSGQHIVFRLIGRSSAASANLWRVDLKRREPKANQHRPERPGTTLCPGRQLGLFR
jgi:hypothetical protein